MEDKIQMYGRNGRQEGSDALSMTMVESWLYDIDLGDGNEEFDGGEDRDINPQVTDTVNDPDKVGALALAGIPTFFSMVHSLM